MSSADLIVLQNGYVDVGRQHLSMFAGMRYNMSHKCPSSSSPQPQLHMHPILHRATSCFVPSSSISAAAARRLLLLLPRHHPLLRFCAYAMGRLAQAQHVQVDDDNLDGGGGGGNMRVEFDGISF